MPSMIPEAREALIRVAERVPRDVGQEILSIVSTMMVRDGSSRRAGVRSPRVTSEVADQIRAYAAAHPDAHLQDIADHFGVNPGRVSEALRWLR